MSFTISLFKFNKKTNSTAVPDSTVPSAELSCRVLTPSSIYQPVIELKTNPIGYTYAYIPAWGRYYFIDNIIIDSGLYRVSLTVDVLATFKTEIGNYNGYVLRSASASDGAIMDNEYAANSNITHTIVDCNRPLANAWNGWANAYFVIGIQGYGNDTGDNSGVIYYQATYTQFIDLLKAFYANSGNASFWGNLGKGVIDSLYHITDYIVSCRAYPVSMEVSRHLSKLYIGAWDSGLTLPKVIGGATFTYAFSNIPKHPQASARGSYMNVRPYTEYYFHSSMIGNFAMDPFIMRDVTDFTITGLIDYTTGEALIDFGNSAHVRFIETSATVGIEIPLAGTEVSVGGLAKGAIETGASILSGNWLGAAAGIGNTLMNGMLSNRPDRSSERGGYAIWSSVYSPYIDCIFHEVVNDDVAGKGRPLCQNVQLNTLVGFMMLDDPHFVGNGATAEENTRVNSFMAGGFYYE